MASTVGKRVQKRRDILRAQGLRPVQIWLPDSRRPGFGAECARQARMTAEADRGDGELGEFLDAALDDLDQSPSTGEF
ncbi:antitoxin MazE family protein [Rhizobium sp. RU36D]|uniref:antitoxin MazE family protein n=1 Tax=Rhizobium sp. RU36D TaxID=1907415 RepID=UPI0009D8F73D|nr:antitoxin MazE family protein [Rhizobium sp. RU36D]SMD10715.1 Protein of unknown function [Rhizobium sp. RU36D]